MRIKKWILLMPIHLFAIASFDLIAQKPNIILILADDLGVNYINNKSLPYSTPNLDSMCSLGISFTNCHASPLCSPSRFMLMTGKYNCRNYKQFGEMDYSNKTIGNLLLNNGYKTALFGKWQLEGGDTAMKKFGFQQYSLFNALDARVDPAGSRYRDPNLYQDGKFVPEAFTKDKYGDDIWTDSILSFIDNNKSRPFFIYYTTPLPHFPFQPTPQDANFKTWDISKSDTAYYKSMVRYLDYIVGRIMNKVNSSGIKDKTYIIFTSDNGSPVDIIYKINGVEKKGGKGRTQDYGTHVPLIITGPDVIKKSKNEDLIDFTDILPTLADLSKSNIPPSFGVTDGLSFAKRIVNKPDTSRQWIFDYYKPFTNTTDLIRWAHTKNHKLYDSLGTYIYYDIKNDPFEKEPLDMTLLNSEQKKDKVLLQKVLDDFASISAPVLNQTQVSNISDISAFLGATITSVGNFTSVSNRGSVYSLSKTMHNSRSLLLNQLSDNQMNIGPFLQLRNQLTPQTYYSYAGFAIKNNLTGYSPTQNFITLSRSVVEGVKEVNGIVDSTTIQFFWNDAIFPLQDATRGGYVILMGKEEPMFTINANGKAPKNVFTSGNLIDVSSARLPTLPPNSIIIDSLERNTLYYFSIIPYTWNGKNDSTYNYFFKGAKTIVKKTATITPKIFPNPSTGSFNLQFSGENLQQVEITVIDIMGRIIQQLKGDTFHNYEFGNQWPGGVYFVKAKQGDHVTVSKIIKSIK